jgi:stage V sporulation protein SpoVS
MTPEEREVQIIGAVNDLAQAVKQFAVNAKFDDTYSWEMLNQAIDKIKLARISLPEEEERLKRLSFDP